MKLFSLQSGSIGNCIYVESRGVRLLFDAGLSGKQTEERLSLIGVDVASIEGVLISHDHTDHVSCAGVLQRKFGLPLWMTAKTHERATKRLKLGYLNDLRSFQSGERISFGPIVVESICTTHDAEDGVGFVVDDGRVRLGVLTDLGHIFKGLPELMSTLDGVLLESNYDLQMLARGPYPEMLKRRIRGQGGHLSNVEAAHLIDTAGKRLRWACLGHISEENNRPDLVLETLRRRLGNRLELFIAPRRATSELIELY